MNDRSRAPRSGRRKLPPAPTLHAVAGDDGSVTVSVEVSGLSAAVLAGTSPGGAPEIRIRRARRMVTDPVYVPVAGSAALAEDPARPGTWVATLTDAPPGGLAAYQRVTYWAEVRYPVELALPPGVVRVPVGDGVTTPPGVPAGNVESAWGVVSLPATAMRVPAAVADIGGLLTFTRDGGGDVISGVLPVTGDFTIQLWSEAPAGELVELVTAPTAAEFSHTEPPRCHHRSATELCLPIPWAAPETWSRSSRPDKLRQSWPVGVHWSQSSPTLATARAAPIRGRRRDTLV